MEEYIEYNKIYAHADESGKVTDIYSEAFKTPAENDICINSTNIDRHGAQHYQVYDENGIANYAIVNGVLVKRDKSAELAEIKATIDYPKIVENIVISPSGKKYKLTVDDNGALSTSSLSGSGTCYNRGGRRSRCCRWSMTDPPCRCRL